MNNENFIDLEELENECCKAMNENIITAEVRYVKHIKTKDGREFDQCFMRYNNPQFENGDGMVEIWTKPMIDKVTHEKIYTHVGNVWYLVKDGFKYKPLGLKHQ